MAEQPSVIVLEALVTSGSFAQWVPIAVGMNQQQLVATLPDWLKYNQPRYGGQYRTVTVPFLLPADSQ